jgi:tetratricopeptide (TPR) repeat protein
MQDDSTRDFVHVDRAKLLRRVRLTTMSLPRLVFFTIFASLSFTTGFSLAQPLGASGYFSQCKRLYDRGVLESARVTCELALAADANHLPSLKQLSRIALDRKDPETAEQFLSRALALSSSDNELQFLSAWSKLQQNLPEETLSILPNAFSNEALLVRAQALEQVGRFEDAYAAFRRLPGSLEARLGTARLGEKLGRLDEALSTLSNTPKEELARARLLWLKGKTQTAAQRLEALVPKLNPSEPDYTKTMGLLAMAYYGLGQLGKGELAVRPLASRTSLPSTLLNRVWPWLVVLVVYLGLILYGESRIEPTRSLDVSAGRLYGPGSMHLWLLLALLIAGFVVALVGQSMYQNLLAAFTPIQGDVVRPVFFFIAGVVVLLISYFAAGSAAFSAALGSRNAWAEGVGFGILLLVLLGGYGYLAPRIDLPGPGTLYPMFFGLAFLEVAIRGMGFPMFERRYRDLAMYMIPILFALCAFGPTLYFVVASALLSWLHKRTGGALAGAVAWVFAGIVLAFSVNIPLVRTLLGL